MHSAFIIPHSAVGRAAVAVLVLACGAWTATAQQLIDRMIARVEGTAVTQSDLEAALGFGYLDEDHPDPLQALVDRRLMTIDMNRRPPEPPDEAAVEREVARMRAAAGARLSRLMATTGMDEARLRQVARETLMLRSYLDLRFPLVAASDADAEGFYRANPGLFTRNGALQPFGSVAAEARRGAAEARREARIDGWLGNLRNRMDVEIVPRQ